MLRVLWVHCDADSATGHAMTPKSHILMVKTKHTKMGHAPPLAYVPTTMLRARSIARHAPFFIIAGDTSAAYITSRALKMMYRRRHDMPPTLQHIPIFDRAFLLIEAVIFNSGTLCRRYIGESCIYEHVIAARLCVR